MNQRICWLSSDPGAPVPTLDKAVVDFGVVLVTLAPLKPKLAFGNHFRTWPTIFDFFQPIGEVIVMPDRHLPNCSYPSEFVQAKTRVEMNSRRIHHFLATTFPPLDSRPFLSDRHPYRC